MVRRHLLRTERLPQEAEHDDDAGEVVSISSIVGARAMAVSRN